MVYGYMSKWVDGCMSEDRESETTGLTPIYPYTHILISPTVNTTYPLVTLRSKLPGEMW